MSRSVKKWTRGGGERVGLPNKHQTYRYSLLVGMQVCGPVTAHLVTKLNQLVKLQLDSEYSAMGTLSPYLVTQIHV